MILRSAGSPARQANFGAGQARAIEATGATAVVGAEGLEPPTYAL